MPTARMVLSRSQRCSVNRRVVGRSEEHTSELQSRLHLVCRLLLEKKKSFPLPSPPAVSRVCIEASGNKTPADNDPDTGTIVVCEAFLHSLPPPCRPPRLLMPSTAS